MTPEEARQILTNDGWFRHKSAGTKHDELKLDWSLCPLSFVAPLVPVFSLGESRYEYKNWQKPFDNAERRFVAAMKRHLQAIEDEGALAVNEVDGGVLHASQIAWNALELIYQMQRYGGDK